MKPAVPLTSFLTTRPIAIFMVFMAAVVFGYLSLGRLPLTLMPELSYPTLTVRTEYPGAAPEEVENDISRPVEEALGVIAGLQRISSISRAGVSDVVLEFAWDSKMSDATQDVLEKLDLVFLPDDAERPLILHYDPSLDPVLELSLSGEGHRFEGETGLRRLRRLAELQIKKELDPVKGIAAVRVRGGLEEEIHVLLEEEALRRTNISIQQVIQRLSQENINVAGGTLKEGRTEYLVRTLNEFENLQQIEETIVADLDGRFVRIKDLGRIVRSHKEREILTRTNGGESVQIEIFKEGDANIVALAKRVRALLGEFDPEAEERKEGQAAVVAGGSRGRGPGAGPSGLSESLYKGEGALLELVADRSLFIESSVKEVRNTAVIGGLLAVFILYLFLRNFLTTFIITLSIPFSLLITFAPLHLLEVSLNIMSLGGLALGIGMLVDSSIVVLESIHRCREEGDAVGAAAVRGTSEVRGAVFASTLTSIAVFFPMVFVEGLAGQAFGDLGLAVVVSLLAAAAVALFFIPMLASLRWPDFASGGSFGYFGTPGWERLRDGFLPRGRLGKLLVSPFFAASFVAGFWPHYIGLAWRELRQTIASSPTWFKILNAHNWLLQMVLLVPLPFVVRGIQRLEPRWVESITAIWSELRQDFSNSSLLLKIFASPFWLLRAVLSVPLPGLLLPGVPWILPLIFASRSWALVRESFHARRPWVRALLVALIAPPVYLVVRTLFGALIEGIGKLFLASGKGAVFIFARIVLPLFLGLIVVLAWIPGKLTDWIMSGLQRTYPQIIRSALARPVAVVLVVAFCFWATWQVVTTLDSELLPEVHQGEFTVEVGLPVGTPLEHTETVVAPIERAILAEKQAIQSLILTVGYDSANSQRSDEGEHTAQFKVLLDENNRGAVAEQAVISRLRERFEGVPDLDARIVRPVLFSSKTPIEVEVHGHDLRRLRDQTDRAALKMASISELADIKTSLKAGAPEVQIVYDRDRLARYGLNIRDVATLVRDKVKGFEATRFNLKDRRIPILVRLAVDDRETVDDVRGMIINPGAERPIRLGAIADVTLGEGPSEVRRIDGRRVAVVSANIGSGSLSAATWEIEDRLRSEIDWPTEMTFFITGQNDEWQRSQRSLWIALALSIFLVYVIMAAQFESLLHPLVIMLTIPLAFVGTVVTLKLLGHTLSIVVFLGMIMLAGIVVNNAIVLVDYINTLRKRGVPRDEAIVQAGSVRLRPILMTTATTVLGLTPMAFGLGDGAEIRTPMAIAVISGLISSTALTLVVIPSFYMLADKLKQRLMGAREPVSHTAGSVAPISGADTVTT